MQLRMHAMNLVNGVWRLHAWRMAQMDDVKANCCSVEQLQEWARWWRQHWPAAAEAGAGKASV
jgi:hypothetical protein